MHDVLIDSHADDSHADVTLTDQSQLTLDAAQRQDMQALRDALARHAESGDPSELGRAFVAARTLVAALGGAGPGSPPDLTEVRRLTQALPELDWLLSTAVDACARGIAAAGQQLWQALGLSSAPPSWTEAERSAARTVFACACGPAATQDPQWLTQSLRRISAGRLSALLTEELCARESVWLRALADRYGSLRHRYAPRTLMRSRGLSELAREDVDCRQAVMRHLERWVAEGACLDRLAAELEAAIVHVRTPARLA